MDKTVIGLGHPEKDGAVCYDHHAVCQSMQEVKAVEVTVFLGVPQVLHVEIE